MIVRHPWGLNTLSLVAALLTLPACSGEKSGAISGPLPEAQAASVSSSGSAGGASAVPEAIRAALQKRFERLPAIDSIEPAPVPGLWEVRMGTEVVYTDAAGDHLIKGEIIETASRRNLTEERVSKLTAIDFASLPLNDAVVWKSGNGSRKIAVFADPNCGYCKRFEQSLKDVKDVTVYTFLYPILGGDSPQKSEAVWCAKDRARHGTA